MKKALLIIFMTITFSTPCLAQIETNGFYSIDNTLWKIFPYNSYFGFSDGIVYVCDEDLESCTPISNSIYINLPFLSLIYIPITEEYPGFIMGFLSPLLGNGKAVVYNYRLMYSLSAKLFKASDNWTPQE